MYKDGVVIFSPHIELYPDQSCKLMAEMTRLIKSMDEYTTITVGNSFVNCKGNKLLFGDAAKEYNEKRLEDFFEDEVQYRVQLNSLLENFEGPSC